MGSCVPGLFDKLGFRAHLIWPFVAAGTLLSLNAGYVLHSRSLRNDGSRRAAKLNLWTQIILDLFTVSSIVYLVGSTETFIPFVYLFHIVLACIFLPRVQSLAVTLVSAVLYGTTVYLEYRGALPPASIYAAGHPRLALVSVVTNALSAIVSWSVVWFMASHLSSLVMKHEATLEETNRRLLMLQREKMQHMLHTTHELKAPFAAIQANTQLLQKGYCGPLSTEAQQTLAKIAARCARLTSTIQEMLQLANLQSESERPPLRQDIDLSAVVRWSIDQVGQIARERQVVITETLAPVLVPGVSDHLKMLVSNLLSNAVLYSRTGGAVFVGLSGASASHAATLIIEDHGIGIAEEKLPRIFDEYYHTDEAVRHNPHSTGLGLSIVRKVAHMHSLGICVESKAGEGTRFTVTFPIVEI